MEIKSFVFRVKCIFCFCSARLNHAPHAFFSGVFAIVLAKTEWIQTCFYFSMTYICQAKTWDINMDGMEEWEQKHKYELAIQMLYVDDNRRKEARGVSSFIWLYGWLYMIRCAFTRISGLMEFWSAFDVRYVHVWPYWALHSHIYNIIREMEEFRRQLIITLMLIIIRAPKIGSGISLVVRSTLAAACKRHRTRI